MEKRNIQKRQIGANASTYHSQPENIWWRFVHFSWLAVYFSNTPHLHRGMGFLFEFEWTRNHPQQLRQDRDANGDDVTHGDSSTRKQSEIHVAYCRIEPKKVGKWSTKIEVQKSRPLSGPPTQSIGIDIAVRMHSSGSYLAIQAGSAAWRFFFARGVKNLPELDYHKLILDEIRDIHKWRHAFLAIFTPLSPTSCFVVLARPTHSPIKWQMQFGFENYRNFQADFGHGP